MRTDYQHVLVQQDGAVVTLTMNRPEKLNAFNDPMLHELTEAAEEAAHDEAIRCVVLTGAGRAFGAGQDLSAFTERSASQKPVKVSEHLQKYHRLIHVLRNMPKPVIAALHGVATGISFNIALSCDLRIAADNVRISEAFARIGLVPDGGGAFFLPRLIGLGKALELALLAEEINGAEAERLGLVNKCVPLAEFEATTHALAQRLAQGPTKAYKLIKELMYTSLQSDLHASLKLEGELQDIAIASNDHQENVKAFLQKRAPKYSGK
ncbi:MAG: enoyl-CoA hydratase-related protein [Ktedonobacteraceae bacterium]